MNIPNQEEEFKKRKVNFNAPVININNLDKIADLYGMDRSAYLNKLIFDDIKKHVAEGVIPGFDFTEGDK